MQEKAPANPNKGSGVADGHVKKSQSRLGQPKATLFLMLTVLWVFPSLGAMWLIGSDARLWFDATSVLAALGMIRLEQWIGMTILIAHGVFGWLTWHYRRNEPLQEIVMGDDPNSDEEPMKRP